MARSLLFRRVAPRNRSQAISASELKASKPELSMAAAQKVSVALHVAAAYEVVHALGLSAAVNTDGAW